MQTCLLRQKLDLLVVPLLTIKKKNRDRDGLKTCGARERGRERERERERENLRGETANEGHDGHIRALLQPQLLHPNPFESNRNQKK